MTSGMTGMSSDVPVLATHTHDKGMCMYACMTEKLNGGNHKQQQLSLIHISEPTRPY